MKSLLSMFLTVAAMLLGACSTESRPPAAPPPNSGTPKEVPQGRPAPAAIESSRPLGKAAKGGTKKSGSRREDPYFGNLTFDDQLNWYEASVPFRGTRITVRFSLKDCSDEEKLLRSAQKVCEDLENWARRVEDYAIQELLPIKNRSWLNEGEKPLTPDQFRRRMTLESITFDPDGDFDFWHDDGDLFCGHSIQVSGHVDRGFRRADIPG